ncbi:Localization factor PodJL [compost metagenome]
MGIFFHLGEGVAQDYAEAFRFVKLAAEQGLTEAECNLGVMYLRGLGVAQDYAKAARWYERAAAKGDENAKGALAKIRSL